MLLVIDIGNTNITLGVFRCESGKTSKGPFKTWRLSTNKSRTTDEYGIQILDFFHYSGLESSEIQGVAVASVVPVLDYVFAQMVKNYFGKKAFFVEPGKTKIIRILYEKPEDVGADRIADAVAAYKFLGGPAIVIDFGTATTFDCIGKKGEYLGGVIAPGPLISAESLAIRTAKLPHVKMVNPGEAIGRSTVKSIQAGLYYGYIGLVKEILYRLKKEIKGDIKVIATGGLAGLIVPEIKEVEDIIPELTLEGIRIIWERSFSKRNK